jgi:prefoldin beta subunit
MENNLLQKKLENIIMEEEEIPKQLQDQINRLQQMRMQLQMITQQRQQIDLRLKEIQEALGELDKTDEKTPVYKSVGAILIKTKGKNEVISELKTNKDSLELRKSTLEKQEGRTKEKLNELQSKVQNALNISDSTSSN